MPNIAKVLKDEIARIARKETKAAVTPLRKPARGVRRAAADLKRKIAALEKEIRAMQKTVAGLAGAGRAAVAEGAGKARITAKGVRSLRRRLRLTGQDFARLLGITSQVVYSWEKASGPLRVRAKTRAAILAVRDIGAREAKRRLAQVKAVARPKKGATKRRPRRRRSR